MAVGAIASIFGNACRKPVPVAPTPTVLVTEVVQKDVPIYSEWVGTTLGFVDAQIHPRVQGYLLKQVYQDGHAVKAGELLFQIDDRDYKAALDQAKGDLAQQQANYLKNKQDLDRDKTLVAQGVSMCRGVQITSGNSRRGRLPRRSSRPRPPSRLPSSTSNGPR